MGAVLAYIALVVPVELGGGVNWKHREQTLRLIEALGYAAAAVPIEALETVIPACAAGFWPEAR